MKERKKKREKTKNVSSGLISWPKMILLRVGAWCWGDEWLTGVIAFTPSSSWAAVIYCPPALHPCISLTPYPIPYIRAVPGQLPDRKAQIAGATLTPHVTYLIHEISLCRSNHDASASDPTYLHMPALTATYSHFARSVSVFLRGFMMGFFASVWLDPWARTRAPTHRAPSVPPHRL